MGFKGVPDRWEDYSNSGNVVKGTRFISFKVPLKPNLLSKVAPGVDNNWGIPNLVQSIPDLGLVIDLTYTSRYYDYRELEAAGLKYSKIMTMGHNIPNHGVIQQFFKSVNTFLAEDPSKLIGVHCTHGLNRTGYLICRYMVEVLGIQPEDAIKEFNEARGHTQERENYLQHLRERGWENEDKMEEQNNETRDKKVDDRKEELNQGNTNNKKKDRWRNKRKERSGEGPGGQETERNSRQGDRDRQYLSDRGHHRGAERYSSDRSHHRGAERYSSDRGHNKGAERYPSDRGHYRGAERYPSDRGHHSGAERYPHREDAGYPSGSWRFPRSDREYPREERRYTGNDRRYPRDEGRSSRGNPTGYEAYGYSARGGRGGYPGFEPYGYGGEGRGRGEYPRYQSYGYNRESSGGQADESHSQVVNWFKD